jgi:uridine kinase
MSTSARFDLRPAHLALGRALRDALAERVDLRRPGLVVGIGGESGSGKSVTAAALARELGAVGVRAGVIHQDDYFVRPPRTNHDYRCVDLSRVGPHEVDLARLQAHVAEFRAGRDGVAAPLSDHATDSFLVQRYDFSATTALVVEGTYVLRLPEIDVRVFLEASYEDTRERRRARARDVDAPVVERILEIEHAIIAPQAADAHVLIDRDFRIRAHP